MGITVGAAIKKILAALVSEPKVLKTLLMTLLVLFVAMLLPTAMVISLLCGGMEIDTGKLLVHIQENMTEAEIQFLHGVENTMGAIESVMRQKGFGARIREAQVLYIMALGDYGSQPDFVSKLVSCFSSGQSDSQLISAVNSAFCENIAVKDFTNLMKGIRSQVIDTSGYTNPGTKNNLDLVVWAKEASSDGWGYVMGTFAQVLTEDLFKSKLNQWTADIEPYKEFIEENYIGLRTADCVGLIKGYSWYDVESGQIKYQTNDMPDINADQFFNYATEKGPISTLPEIPGLILHAPGHVGIYIGNGYAVEARGTLYGVVTTKVANRNWTDWCKNPYITYIETEKPQKPLPGENNGPVVFE